MSIRFPQVGAFVPSFVLAVSAQASITGYVLLPDYSGASGATVTLKSTGASAVTDATGAFNVDISTEGIAQAPWAILNTSRARTVYVSVTASGVVTSASSSNVYDGTVSMSIPVTLAAMPSDVAKFVNWLWDNRQASGGYLDYCIRWQSATKLTQTYRGLRLCRRCRRLEHRPEDGDVGGLVDGDYGNGRLVSAHGRASD